MSFTTSHDLNHFLPGSRNKQAPHHCQVACLNYQKGHNVTHLSPPPTPGGLTQPGVLCRSAGRLWS